VIKHLSQTLLLLTESPYLRSVAVIVLIIGMNGCSYWPFGNDEQAGTETVISTPMIQVTVNGVEIGRAHV